MSIRGRDKWQIYDEGGAGPYFEDPILIMGWDEEDETSIDVASVAMEGDRDEQMRTARLIAAAPQMLALLRQDEERTEWPEARRLIDYIDGKCIQP